jgi:hypothetical protein
MKRFIRITQEAVYGTYASGGTAINIRLSGNNAFTPMTDPEFWSVMDGSGLSEQVLFGSETSALGATLTTELTYSQAQFLLGWGLTRINGAQTAPWTTAELPNDLASCTIDFAWSQFDVTTMKRKRFTGCKVASVGLAGARGPGDGAKMMLTMAILGSTPQGNSFDASSDPTAVAFPEPALTVFPTDIVTFQHLRGGFSVATVSRTNFESINVSVNNNMNPYFDESRFANAMRLGGRSVTVGSRMRLKSTVDDRATYEQAAAQALSLTWAGGGHTIVLNLQSRNLINPYKEDLPLDREVYYPLTYNGHLDQTAGAMLALTVT